MVQGLSQLFILVVGSLDLQGLLEQAPRLPVLPQFAYYDPEPLQYLRVFFDYFEVPADLQGLLQHTPRLVVLAELQVHATELL